MKHPVVLVSLAMLGFLMQGCSNNGSDGATDSSTANNSKSTPSNNSNDCSTAGSTAKEGSKEGGSKDGGTAGGKTSSGNAPCWKAFTNGGYCPTQGATGVDTEDVDALEALLNKAMTEKSVPQGKTLVGGFSQGASMSYNYFCQKSNTFNGLAATGAAWWDPWVGFPSVPGSKGGGKSRRLQKTETGTGKAGWVEDNCCSSGWSNSGVCWDMGNTNKEDQKQVSKDTSGGRRLKGSTDARKLQTALTPQCSLARKMPVMHLVGENDVYCSIGAPAQGCIPNFADISTRVLGCAGANRSCNNQSFSSSNIQGTITCREYETCPAGVTVNKILEVAGMGHDASAFPDFLVYAFQTFFSTSAPSPQPAVSASTRLNLTWNGIERVAFLHTPSSTPVGMIMDIPPATTESGTQEYCSYKAPTIVQRTGAAYLCPVPRTYGSGPATAASNFTMGTR